MYNYRTDDVKTLKHTIPLKQHQVVRSTVLKAECTEMSIHFYTILSKLNQIVLNSLKKYTSTSTLDVFQKFINSHMVNNECLFLVSFHIITRQYVIITYLNLTPLHGSLLCQLHSGHATQMQTLRKHAQVCKSSAEYLIQSLA